MHDNPYAPPTLAAEQGPPADESGLAVSIFCSTCSAVVYIGDVHCPGCGRAITRDEERALQTRWEASDPEVARSAESSFWGRVAIGLAAGMATVQAALSFESSTLVVWGAAIALVLWAAFVWSFRNAWLAGAVALGTYVVFWLAPIVFAPLSILNFWLLKILTFLALMSGVASEARMRRRRRRLMARMRPSAQFRHRRTG